MTSMAEIENTGNTSLLEINFGPQHPSTHGVFRMTVQLEGAMICGLKPVFGYLHRNHEQIAENLPYAAIMPYTDRLDYVNALANNFGYALTIEKLAGLEVPERAEYIRVILAELARIVAGLVPALVFGVAVGNVLTGAPFRFDSDLRMTYEGGLLGLFTPFTLLTGLLSVAMLVLHGAGWLAL